jgi:uncharacterized phage infection (PIP) family protein YhgE
MRLGYFLKLVVLFSLTVFAYQNSDTIVKNIRTAVHEHFPCAIPLTYSLGTFDARFGLSQEEFLTHIATSEKAWEDVVNKELFRYVDTGGDLTVNLIYDERQETTNKLQAIGGVIDGKKDTYESLKADYEKLSAQLRQQRATYNTKLGEFQTIQNGYEKEVARWNKRGGAPEEEYTRLEKQRAEINARVTTLNTSLAQLNKTVTAVNTLGTKINALIEDLQLNVEKYNTTKSAQGEEFSEWEYVFDPAGKRINIYEFGSILRLSRVLIHELGHTLQMDHVGDAEAIMYRLNAGKSETLTEADKTELMRVCRVR